MSEHGAAPGLLPIEPQRSLTGRTWAIAAFSVLLILVLAVLATQRRTPDQPNVARPADAHAGQLVISGLELLEATNGTGGKAFYVDGSLRNMGQGSLVAATIQAKFTSADGKVLRRESLPLALVRTREPYVDLQPVSAAPVHAGEQRGFRLIFDAVPDGWDMKVPEVRIVHATLQ